MKKILILLFGFLLTGCFEDSGHLVKSCTLEEKANDLSSKTVYTFGFKEDIIDELKVLYEYSGDNTTISSIKLSFETQNKFFENINYQVLSDNDNNYKIEYNLDINENYYDKFFVKNKRSELVELLESENFICE